MHPSAVTVYANLADAKERDPIIIPGEHGRAEVANGRMSKWQRFNRGALVLIHDAEGNERWLTPNQARVARGIARLAGTRQRTTIRHLGELLSLSPSAVSRTSVRLASFGLIAYQANRGRYGGTIYVLRQAADGLDWFRDEAKAKVRAWAKAAAARFARLISNVATYPYDVLRDREALVTSTGRNIKTGWTPEELREAGII